MAPGILLSLFVLLQLYSVSVFSSSLSLSKHCGTEEVKYLEDSGDGFPILINNSKIGNSTFACEKLVSYFADGCFVCDPKLNSWRKVRNYYCGGDLDILPRISSEESFGKETKSRKLLREIDCMKNNGHSSENKQNDDNSSKKEEDLPLAVPGFILLSVGFLFPCFRAKRRESPPSVRHNNQFNNLVVSVHKLANS